METRLIDLRASGMSCEERTQREALLRQAVLAGDETAWRAWCLESFDELDRYVLWRCGGRRDRADDIVQEAWLTAVRSIRRFDPSRASFLAWLRGIAANVRRNHARREKRNASRQFSSNGQVISHESASAAPEDDRAEAIATVLDALSDRQEAVLRAKYFDGLTVEGIANAWNETPKAIESLLTRAREAFRERFQRLTNAED